MLSKHRSRAGHRCGCFYDVPELPHVAGPGTGGAKFDGGLAEVCGSGTLTSGSIGVKEGIGQRGEIFEAFPQRRKSDARDSQAMEKVLSKEPASRQVVQILIGGGDQTKTGALDLSS